MDIPAPQLSRIDEWLFGIVDKVLIESLGTTITTLAQAIYPVVGLCLTISLLLYSLAVMRGLIDQPVSEFIWKVVKISVVSSLIFSGAYYASDIVKIVVNLPDELSQAVLPGNPITGTIGKVFSLIMTPINQASSQLKMTDIGKSILIVLFCLICILGAAFLSAISALLVILVKVSLALLVSVGPIFISAALFEHTKEMFSRWVSQIINYVMLGVLFTLLFSLVMGINVALIQESARWVEDANNVALMSVMFAYVFIFGASIYVLLQLPTIASALSGGFGLQIATPSRMIGNTFRK